MTKCIGCRCCEVACTEQNGNPFEINWRRVGEIEGGSYPYTQRLYLSMGCNHCLEPACLEGCPVDAYTKNTLTGLVLHSADACIGCDYCTWNCPYGVPQYNGERGVVGKCDMCHNRLDEGRAPACVNACPEQAIQIEMVNIAEWRADHSAANAPGMPSADHTISTTRITLPDKALPGLRSARITIASPRRSALAAGLHAGAHAAFGRRLPVSVAAARGPRASTAHRGAGGGLPLAGRLHAPSRPADPRLARPQDVAAIVAEPRSAAVLALRGRRLPRSAAIPGLSPAGRPLLRASRGVTASASSTWCRRVPPGISRHTLADFYLTGLLLGPLFLATDGDRCSGGGGRGGRRRPAAQSTAETARAGRLGRVRAARLGATAVAASLRNLLLARIGSADRGRHRPAAAARSGGRPSSWRSPARLLSRYLFFVSVVPEEHRLHLLRQEGRMNLKRLAGLDNLSEEYAYGHDARIRLRWPNRGWRTTGCPPPAATARSAAAC